ncbi:YchJ family protein [Salinicola lusitanus]|uniref:YchJ family protein n=1 Tax=Salinicola lusitanus TaxID=1949085 RepID=UPI000DA19BB1|nr:YchJ family metal-binding protein [Salinicola lusitanus]
MNVPTTVTEAPDALSCPCGSGRSYERCCGIYHRLEQAAPTPEALMRSRYTAFALGGLGGYLVSTWDPGALDPTLTSAALDQRDQQWLGLEIVDVRTAGARATVEFKARFRPRRAVPAGPDQTLHERSRFHRHRGNWLYVDGIIDPPPADSPSRNAPCPCGSGKKAKRCCLQ